MRKVWVVGLVCLMVAGASAWAPKKVSAQGLLESFSGVNPLDLGNVRVIASAKVGYQNMGLRFNVPFYYQSFYGPEVEGMGGAIRDANVWVGGLAAAAEIASLRNVSVFVNAWGAVPKRVRVDTDNEFTSVVLRYDWQGNGLTWWELDGGLAWKLREDLSILGGFRRDKLSVGLSDAISQGQPVDFHGWRYGRFFIDNTFTSDIQSGEWTIYIGARFASYGNRSCILVGPAWLDLKVPLQYSVHVQTLGHPENYDYGSAVWAHGIMKPGVFFEANTEQEIQFGETWRVKFWGRATWTSVRGLGSSTRSSEAYVYNWAPWVPSSQRYQGGEVSDYSRHLLAGGVSAEWSF